MAQLPVGAMYAFLALLFITMFAVVHYPCKYVPICIAYTKQKLLDYGLREKAGVAILAMKGHARTAFRALVETEAAKKGLEAVGAAKLKVSAAATQVAASQMASTSMAVADSIRLNMGEKLAQARHKVEPAAAAVVPPTPDGVEKVCRPTSRPACMLTACRLSAVHAASPGMRPDGNVSSLFYCNDGKEASSGTPSACRAGVCMGWSGDGRRARVLTPRQRR